MPRKGSAYPIDDDWRRRVTDRIKEMEISQNELARLAKVSKASLSEALSKTSKQSTCVPAIHRALGWPPPMPLVIAPDAAELLFLYDALSDFARGELIAELRARTGKTKKKRV